MGEIPESHPRFTSLMARKKMTEAAAAGLLADSALIAHGRGEAFDYLLGEQTVDAAKSAIMETASRLLNAKMPVISVNGNTVALAGVDLIACAAVIGCPIEVNIYYRTPERMSALLEALEAQRIVACERFPELSENILLVDFLGGEPDAKIPGLEGPRANCHNEGIFSSDVILVPLEDGDRCEALVNMGKTVCIIDLNPLSRTAKTSSIAIVDELTRCVPLLLQYLNEGEGIVSSSWDNQGNLRDVLSEMLRNFEK